MSRLTIFYAGALCVFMFEFASLAIKGARYHAAFAWAVVACLIVGYVVNDIEKSERVEKDEDEAVRP